MSEVFEKIIENLEEKIKEYDKRIEDPYYFDETDAKRDLNNRARGIEQAIEIVEQAAIEYNNGWIPVESGKLPENEKGVEITFTRKHYKTGETLYLTARAFYEDGTLTTEDSSFCWDETDNWEYCEEKAAYIIPEGWFEGVSFAEQSGVVDMPVIAWRYLPEPYQHQPNREKAKKTNYDMCCESMEAMAQIIDIAKIGWTKEQIMEWLQSEAEEWGRVNE